MAVRKPLVMIGGVVRGLPDDDSLSGSSEWTAEVVTQAEAEAGTATTARKWTAQRVRQAITGWWSGIGTAFGKSLLSLADAAAGRTALGLGDVDNTSDADKPISTATANALDTKFDKAGGLINGPISVAGNAATKLLTLERFDTSAEGGQVNFNRSLDNAAAFSLDVLGSTDQTTLRLLRYPTSASAELGLPLRINGDTDAVLACGAGGLGYGNGAGGTVVQPTSKTTDVTLNKPTGTITMFSGLTAGQDVVFRVYNNKVSTTDVIVVTPQTGVLQGYSVEADIPANGYFRIRVKNIMSTDLSITPVIGFSIIKGSRT